MSIDRVFGGESARRAVQIVCPDQNGFHLQVHQLKRILEVDDIKDRDVVVVSIAGAFRCGKSFMLNFFSKYLNAQYKRHDITEWLGHSLTQGFQWQSGRERKTVGIWMWSEIFTHDFANGDRVAIILLDTQGMFDDKSSLKANSSIFALSTMLSSVQCYNIMRNIQEDHLQHLELFTEYGRLASEHSSEKPFQKLMFLVRDWPNAFETSYGHHARELIDQIFAENDADKTSDMLAMRKRIASSFDEIGIFLMPHPGMVVAQGNKFTGDMQTIEPDFLEYMEELVDVLFAPEHLTIKQINGQRVRARDFLVYLQTYVDVFNGDTMPELDTVFVATAKASCSILYDKCLNDYKDAMSKASSGISDSDLLNIHHSSKAEAVRKFQENKKFGGNELGSSLNRKLDEEIEREFLCLKRDNGILHSANNNVVIGFGSVGAIAGTAFGSLLGPIGAAAGSWLGAVVAASYAKEQLKKVKQ